MTITDTRPDDTHVAAASASAGSPSAPARREPRGAEAWLLTGDHKKIGRLFVGASLIYAVAGMVIAALLGIERIDSSGTQILQLNVVGQLFSLYAIGMVFLFRFRCSSVASAWSVAGRRPEPRLPSRGGRVVLGMVGLVGRPDASYIMKAVGGATRRASTLPRVVLGPVAVAPARRDLRRRHGARPSGARHDDEQTSRRVGSHRSARCS